MGGIELRKKAQEWLDSTAADAVDAEKEEMRKQLAALQEQMAALLASQPKPAAEPPKAVATKEK